jgi:hypothetical protein
MMEEDVDRIQNMHWATGDVQHILVTKSETERLLERPNSRWEDNIKVDLEYMCEVYTGFKRILLGLIRDGLCEHGNELSGTIKEAEPLTT